MYGHEPFIVESMHLPYQCTSAHPLGVLFQLLSSFLWTSHSKKNPVF